MPARTWAPPDTPPFGLARPPRRRVGPGIARRCCGALLYVGGAELLKGDYTFPTPRRKGIRILEGSPPTRFPSLRSVFSAIRHRP